MAVWFMDTQAAMDKDDGPHSDDMGARHNHPAQRPLEGGQGGQGHRLAGDRRLRLRQATEEDQTAIRAILSRQAEFARPEAGGGRATSLAWAGMRVVALVLLAAGAGMGLGDGDEFDDVGCTVAQRPGGTAHSARSPPTREQAGLRGARRKA